jgi:hypothetical protein
MIPAEILTLVQRRIDRIEGNRADLAFLWKRFGHAVRETRRSRRIKLADFAKGLSRTPTMCSYMEAGKRVWPLDKAKLAVKLLSK